MQGLCQKRDGGTGRQTPIPKSLVSEEVGLDLRRERENARIEVLAGRREKESSQGRHGAPEPHTRRVPHQTAG